MVWSPLAGGLLSGKFGPGAPGNGEGRARQFDFPPVDRGSRLGLRRRHARDRRKHGVSVAQVALAWLLAQALRDERHHRRQPHGAARPQPRRDELTLDAEEIARLDEVSALPASIRAG